VADRELNVVCVWVGPKNKTHYNVEYVEKLYSGVKRNLKRNFKFFVLTDIPETITHKNIHALKYSRSQNGYWAKIDLFAWFVNTPTLYLDLDVVITGDITAIIDECYNSRRFHMVQSPDKGWANSSIMYWDGNYAWMTMEFNRNAKLWRKRFYRLAQGNIGDQAYITFQLNEVGGHKYIRECSWWQEDLTQLNADAPFLIGTGYFQKPHRENIDNEEVKKLIAENWI
jgi:hypothetical protein